MWDHLLVIVLLNFAGVILLGIDMYLLHVLRFYPKILILGVLFTVITFILYIGVVSMVTKGIADYQAPTFKECLQYIQEIWRAALVFSLITIFQVLIFLFVLPWYFKMGTILGIFLGGLIFWASVIWLFAAQYYFPIRCRLDTNIKKIIHKSFAMFFDNTFFSVVLGVGALLIFVLSSFTAFLLPGIGTLLLWHQVGLKLRLYKYDYLETHPEAKRRNIPWHVLLEEEKGMVGKRTLKGMIFPWKE